MKASVVLLHVGLARDHSIPSWNFTDKVLHVIGLSPCQPDHAFKSWIMIKFYGHHHRYERCVIQSPVSYLTTSLSNYDWVQRSSRYICHELVVDRTCVIQKFPLDLYPSSKPAVIIILNQVLDVIPWLFKKGMLPLILE